MERLCCILDYDEQYAVRMSACFNRKKALPFQMKAFSDVEAYSIYAKDNRIELLLVTDAILPLIRNSSGAELIICLRENSLLMEGDDEIVSVAKYQASDGILREVAAIYGDYHPDTKKASRGEGTRVISVYSPCGNIGKTTLCLALAHIKGKNKKTLYLNLEEFSSITSFLPEKKGNLSDALFFYYTSEKQGNSKLMSVITSGNGFDYIAPASCAEDLAHFSPDMIMGMIKRVTDLGGYELIIVDLGSLIKEPWQQLSNSDYVLCPQPKSVHDERRQMEFEKYMLEIGMTEVVDRLIKVAVPYDEHIYENNGINFARMDSGAFRKLVDMIDIE